MEPPAKEPVIVLSAEQQKVLDMIVNDGTSLFFTGSAGTGKSVLLRALIQALRRKYHDDGTVAVTATTGIAACNIGCVSSPSCGKGLLSDADLSLHLLDPLLRRGSTVHSFAGIGLGKDPVPVLVKKIRGLQARSKLESWLKCKVWIIDERASLSSLPPHQKQADLRWMAVSMLDGILFDKLATLGSTLRGNNKPFGGIQVRSSLPPPASKTHADFLALSCCSW